MEWLGEKGGLNELKIVVSPDQWTMASVKQKSLEIAVLLKNQGFRVKEIQIPPLGKHPHQSQMQAVLTLLLIFSILALVLSGILAAAIISGIMAREVRQIGVMKVIGANNRQIGIFYIVLILLISSLAVMAGMPLGFLAGEGLAGTMANLLNFTLYSRQIPPAAYAIVAAAGLMMPLIIALVPITLISRKTVREAISDYGVRQESFKIREPNRIMVLLGKFDRTLMLAIRNTFRRWSRLILTLTLLAAGGGMFMAALNVQTAWDSNLDKSFKTRRYDFELRLNRPESIETVLKKIKSILEVKEAEAWGYSPVSLTQPGGIEIIHTYPDGGHESLTLKGVPDGSELVKFPVLKGRWLQTGDSNAVVLNQLAQFQLSNISPGADISLTVNNRSTVWHVVGIIQEIGPASAYVAENAFESVLNHPGNAESFRIVIENRSLEARGKAIRQIEQALSEANIGVSVVVADAEFRNAITEHIFILIFSLIAMAVLLAIVGLLGLASAIGTNIVERTREFGVMRTIGGTPGVLMRNIVSEAVFTGCLSLIFAFVISLPLSHIVGGILGNMSFKVPLALAVSSRGIWIWLLIIILGSAATSAYPALRVSKMSIRDTLVYE